MIGVSDEKLAELNERRSRVAALSRQRLTVEQIARCVGTTPRTVARDREKLGLANPPKPLSENEILHVKHLLEDGASYCEAARSVGRPNSRDHLARLFPGYVLNRQQAAERSVLARQAKRILS